MTTAFLISADRVWMRPSTNACSFLASSYSAFSVMSPCSLASWMRAATSARRTLTSSSSSCADLLEALLGQVCGLVVHGRCRVTRCKTSTRPHAGGRRADFGIRGPPDCRSRPALSVKCRAPPACALSRRIQACREAAAGAGAAEPGSSASRSEHAMNTVSSPAMEPATSGQPVRSSAAAMACADPGTARTTSISPAGPDLDRAGRAGSAPAAPRRSSPAGPSAAAARSARAVARLTLMRPSSATSRLTVAWVARKPRSRSAAASSCWVGSRACPSRSRIACWRSRFMTSIASHCGPRTAQSQRTEQQQPKTIAARDAVER